MSARLASRLPAALAALVAEETDEPTIVYPLIQLGDRALAARTARSRLIPAAATAVLELGSAYLSAALTGDDPPDALGVGLLLVGPILVTGRRWPFTRAAVALGVALTYAWLGYPVGLLGLAAAVLLARAAFGGRLLACFALAVAGGGLAIAAAAVDPATVSASLAGIYAAGLVAVCFGADGRRIRRQRDAGVAQVADQARLRRSAEQRSVIARDLHQGLSQQISLMSARARIARTMVDGGRSPVPGLTPRTALDDIIGVASQVLAELRAVGGLLDSGRGPARVPSPGLAGLPDLVRHWRESGLEVRVFGTADRLLRATDQAAYRFVEEGVAEVSRRSSGLVATVYLEELGAAGGNRLAITVADTAAGERLGDDVGESVGEIAEESLPVWSDEDLLSAVQRAEALGATVVSGQVAIHEVPDGARASTGWVLRAVLPVS